MAKNLVPSWPCYLPYEGREDFDQRMPGAYMELQHQQMIEWREKFDDTFLSLADLTRISKAARGKSCSKSNGAVESRSGRGGGSASGSQLVS